MAVTLSSLAGAGAQFFDNNGVPLAGGLIYTYLAGTTTPAATYTSSTGLTAHTNPIVLNAAGRIATGEVWLTSGVDYKFIVQTALFVQLGSYDNIPSVNDFTSIYAALANTSNVALGDALIGFKQSNSAGNLSGAVGRTVHQKLQEHISVKDFGAVGDGVTDDTAAIQTALDSALTSKKTVFLPAGTYCVKESSSGSGYALLNKGVAMVGEGTFYSKIQALSSMQAGTDFIRVTPNNGAYIDFLNFSRFSIEPTNASVKYGRHCIFMDFPTETNCSFFYMSDMYLFSGNDVTFKISNNTAVNFQGVPANSVIERCAFWEGTELFGVGDSISIRNNVFRSSNSSRTGIKVAQTTASGTASMCVVRENNFDCMGGAFIVTSGRNTKFINNNVELSAGSGTVNGTVIDIDGSGGLIPFAEVSSNHIGIFGTATATSAIRLGGSLGCNINNNTILSGITVTQAILITAAAGAANVGFNEISPQFTNAYSVAANSVSGVNFTLPLINGFTNTFGYAALSYMRYANGIVTLDGVINAPATPNGITIAVLPYGFYPSNILRSVVSTVVGGLQDTGVVEIGSTGNLIFYGDNVTTRIEIMCTFQAYPSYLALSF